MIKDLEFATPESQGIRSEDILEFMDYIAYRKINLHSFMMARNGKIIAECYVNPFHKDFAHRIYSASKTYVALAVGLMVTEGKVKVTDKVVDYLQDYIDTPLDHWVQEMTIEDCLTMRQPMFPDKKSLGEKDKARCYNLMNHSYATYPNGSIFCYHWAPDLLCVAIKRITGMEFIDYLRPIFDEIGVSKDIWCVKTTEDYCWGTSGIVCTLRDFAKVGEFLMHYGNAGGKQLIDRAYIEKATSSRVFTLSANNYDPIRGNGYGYYTWITPDAVLFRGMGTQHCYCFRDKDFLFVCQADTQSPTEDDSPWMYDAVKHLVYDRIGRKKKEGKAYLQLQEALQNMQPPAFGKPHAAYAQEIDGKTYTVNPGNPMGWKNFRFDFDPNGSEGTLTYENDRGVKKIPFGIGQQKRITFPETHYYDKVLGVPADRELDSTAVCEWLEEKKLLLRVYVIDTCFGSMFATFSFKGNEVALAFRKCAECFLDEYRGDGSGYRAE
ncbi:MAG: serine hydrolase [Oscillospiraceae bacterium]|nr:serine hydrolase [Oscillospiraceae bacterium]